MEILNIMLPAFLECLVLVGIHTYLGLHVIKRGVIFVDLALAQIAAFGTTTLFIFHISPDSAGAFWISLGATAIGALIFSLLRRKNGEVPLEAGIGLTYAVFAALTVLVIEKAPHGAEHIHAILTGSLLWVQWKTIAVSAGVYTGVGAFHYLFRKRFILLSENPEAAREIGLNVRLWDFLFYLTFGIVITVSVKVAGVLLVFVFLIAPSILTIMLAKTWRARLVTGWITGTLVSMAGLTASYLLDIPSGPTVIICYAVALLAAQVKYLRIS